MFTSDKENSKPTGILTETNDFTSSSLNHIQVRIRNSLTVERKIGKTFDRWYDVSSSRPNDFLLSGTPLSENSYSLIEPTRSEFEGRLTPT